MRAHVGSILEAAVPMGQSGKGIRNAATSDIGSALPALLIAGLPSSRGPSKDQKQQIRYLARPIICPFNSSVFFTDDYLGCTFGSPPGVPGGGMTLR
jgi:hypothetical protein